MEEIFTSWFFIFPIISGILCFVLTGLVYDYTRYDEVAVFFTLFIISVIIWVSGLVYINIVAGEINKNFKWELVETQYIYAIKDTTGIEGKFGGSGSAFGFIMRGYIKEKWQYVFYIKNGESITMRQADATNTNIIERDNEQPKEMIYRKKLLDFKFLWWNIKEHYVEEYYNDIIVPVGTVLNEYQLDLEK